MKSWVTTYTETYQVRTNKGRLISYVYSAEMAEYEAVKGRGRIIWRWDSSVSRYRVYRTY